MAVFSGPRYGGGRTPAEVRRLREEADKHNQMYTANLKIALAALPKYVLGTYAATVLDTAVRETKHDSGRFAANWNLALKGALPETMPSPLNYGETGEKFGSVGKKGDTPGIAIRVAVLMAKRAYYGYRKGSNGFMALTKGRIADAIYPHGGGVPGSDMSGSAGRILLYNPFMKPNQRIANWWPLEHPASRGRKGRGYASYAMRKGAAPGQSGPLGSGMLQKHINELQHAVRKATAAKTLMDPRNVTIK